MKRKVTIIAPPTASSDKDLDLVQLTARLVATGNDNGTGGGNGLGGEGGYGVNYENDVFMMKRYCWCGEEDTCMWCGFYYSTHDPLYQEIEDNFGTKVARGIGAPNFFYKPTGFGIKWYKWIGRDMKQSEKISNKKWKEIMKHCFDSITTSTTQPTIEEQVIQDFRKKFVDVGNIRAVNLNGEKYIMGKAKDAEEFLVQALAKQKEACAEAHETESGYCCACPYDIACIEDEIKTRVKRELKLKAGRGNK